MEAAIHITYLVDLDEEDANKIKAGEMSANEIDWIYYVEESVTINLESVDIL